MMSTLKQLFKHILVRDDEGYVTIVISTAVGPVGTGLQGLYQTVALNLLCVRLF